MEIPQQEVRKITLLEATTEANAFRFSRKTSNAAHL